MWFAIKEAEAEPRRRPRGGPDVGADGPSSQCVLWTRARTQGDSASLRGQGGSQLRADGQGLGNRGPPAFLPGHVLWLRWPRPHTGCKRVTRHRSSPSLLSMVFCASFHSTNTHHSGEDGQLASGRPGTVCLPGLRLSQVLLRPLFCPTSQPLVLCPLPPALAMSLLLCSRPGLRPEQREELRLPRSDSTEGYHYRSPQCPLSPPRAHTTGGCPAAGDPFVTGGPSVAWDHTLCQ